MLCLYEICQMFFEGLYSYFSEIENYLDVVGQLFYIIYFIMQSESNKRYANGEEDTSDQAMLNLLSLSVLLLNLRMADHLAVFSKNIRTMMTVIFSAIHDIVYFLFILYMFIIILSISNFVVNGRDKQLFLTIIEEYQLMFGENAEAYDIYKEDWLICFLYIAGTNLIVVVCLNILISIVQDNYDNVQLKMQATNFKQKAKILLENEKFMYWKRNSGAKKYIFILNYETGERTTAID